MGNPTNSQEFSGNPEKSDLIRLCHEFNRLGVKYIVLDGFAIQQHGFQRATGDIDGVPIPFASPALLWRTKQTFREKDNIDLLFLERLFKERGEVPQAC